MARVPFRPGAAGTLRGNRLRVAKRGHHGSTDRTGHPGEGVRKPCAGAGGGGARTEAKWKVADADREACEAAAAAAG
jgi:hypothetical protein